MIFWGTNSKFSTPFFVTKKCFLISLLNGLDIYPLSLWRFWLRLCIATFTVFFLSDFIFCFHRFTGNNCQICLLVHYVVCLYISGWSLQLRLQPGFSCPAEMKGHLAEHRILQPHQQQTQGVDSKHLGQQMVFCPFLKEVLRTGVKMSSCNCIEPYCNCIETISGVRPYLEYCVQH